MNSVKDMLRDADPLRHEPPLPDDRRDRLRQAVHAAGSRGAAPSARRSRTPLAVMVAVALIIFAIAAAGSRIWPHGGTTVHAAVRFEVRLAEDHAAAGLREAKVTGSGRVIYLHEDIVVGNDDIERSSVIPGADPSHFGVGIQFTTAGARKMQEATTGHVGRPLAVLIDGDVVMAPTLRDPVSTSSVISGDFSRAEAERIVSGIGVR
jgi:hypothetical protein